MVLKPARLLTVLWSNLKELTGIEPINAVSRKAILWAFQLHPGPHKRGSEPTSVISAESFYEEDIKGQDESGINHQNTHSSCALA